MMQDWAQGDTVTFTLEPPANGKATGTLIWGGGTGTGSGNWYRLDMSTESNPANQEINSANYGGMMGGNGSNSGPCGSNTGGMMTGNKGTNAWDYYLLYGYPGTVATDDTVYGQPGNGGANGARMCQDRLNEASSCAQCANSGAQYLTMPVVEYGGGNGSNAKYTVTGFCYAKILQVSGNNVELQFEGQFPATAGGVVGSGTCDPQSGTGSCQRRVVLVQPS
ncbi:MAG: hypothetical protein M0Z27_03380 [Thermaerobacter sp.]|nr:hypothetical protein [Thermaerobacter sp.]